MAEQFKQTAKLNGYQPRSWGDVVAIATLIAMMMSVVAWGLKLESELNAVRDRQFEIIRRIDVGVLPRAEERIKDLERRMDKYDRNTNH